MNKVNATKVSTRAQLIQPFHVMDILAQARQLEAQGKDVIHLEVGEPDFTTPDRVKAAAIKAINNDKTFYTPATGLIELRQAISDYYQSELNARVRPENIVITPGASGALQLALSAILNPGDKVLMADPGYPCNRHFVRLLEACAEPVNVGADSHYQLNASLLESHWQDAVKAVLVASPSNPTGRCVSREQMQELIAVVDKKQGILLVDEIYQGLVYEADNFSAAGLSSNLFVINSFSKFFAMTGWRLGWLVVPDDYLAAVDRLAQNLFLAPPTVSQYAALSAFEPETLKLLHKRRDELQQRRDFLFNGLQKLGFKLPTKPDGAFYIYADISQFSDDSFSFCQQLLTQANVAITPGLDFGENQAARYVRFAYTQRLEKLQTALDRIAVFLSS